MQIRIDRIHLALHGVSAQIVEAAINGLEGEIGRRLTAAGSAIRRHPVDIGELSIGPVHGGATLEAGALRSLIAEQLVQAIHGRLSAKSTKELN